MVLKAPFPWFGGKSRVAHVVWDRFGNVPNYVEPFAGSLAVLLGRPHDARNETVNDKDAYLANFWLAIKCDPEAVARWADDPVNETFLHSRHRWLVYQGEQLQRKMEADPEYFDAKIAGWWVWGISQWIGSGWCDKPEWRGRGTAARAPRGLNGSEPWRPRPHLPRGAQGVEEYAKRQLLGKGGRGVHRNIPTLDGLADYMAALAQRLRRVRVCCGEWDRILGPSPTTKIGLTGVLLDPPYDLRAVRSIESGSDGAAPSDKLYAHHNNDVSARVREWAIEHGADPLLRIALCGYEGEHQMPESWECLAWKANGGYSNQAAERNANPSRERIWFSPYCLKPGLFQDAGAIL